MINGFFNGTTTTSATREVGDETIVTPRPNNVNGMAINWKSVIGYLIGLILLFIFIWVIARAWRQGSKP